MKRTPKKDLSAQYFLRITQLFNDKGWSIEDGNEEENSLFNRYCERIKDISENKKRDLMLDLSERYLWIQSDSYSKYLIDALISLVSSRKEFDIHTEILVMQLIAPEDRYKTKSSAMLVYMFNNVEMRYNSVLSKYKFQIEHDFSIAAKKLQLENTMLILADDFIGTGETAEKCIQYVLEQGIDIRKIAIVSLVAQEQGIKYLEKYDIPVVASIIRNRGISDYYEGEALQTNIALMEDIERRMAIKQKYRFGYNGSEALVTMCRTPNNTFPLFWDEEGNMKVAPFPRF